MAANERKILTTLALDGEAAFKKSMDEAYRSMKVLGSEMKLNTAIFGDNGKSMEGLTNKGEILGKEIQKQKEIVAAFAKALADSTAAYGAGDKRTEEYRIKLNNAQAALVGLEGKLQDNESAIKNFGKETETASQKTLSWKENLEKLDAGLQSGINALKPVAAGIAAIGTAAIAAGTQIFNSTAEMGKYADELITMSNQTGVSTQTLQEWTYAAQFIDTEVETMTGSMAKMIRQMDAARTGTGDSAAAFATLGISVTDSSGQLLNSQTVFMQAIDALGRVANETERDALAMQIFGKSAQDLNPLIIAGSAELQRLGQEAQNTGVVMSTQTITAFGAFDDSMNTLNATIDGAKNSFLTALLPAIQSIIPVVQDLALKFGDWLRSDGAQQLLSDLGAKIQSVATWISENLTTAVNGAISVFNTIADTLGWVTDNFGTLVTIGGIVTGMLATLKIAQIAVNIAMAANPMGLIIIAIGALVTAIVALISNWDNVKKSITQVWDSIKKAVSDGVEKIRNAFQSVIDWFGNIVNGIWKIGENIVNGIWDGISGAYNWIKDKISGWVDSVLGWFKDLFGIHSPSSVMRDIIGKPMGKGVVVGFVDEASKINDAMASIIPDAKSTAIALDVTRRFNDVAGSGMSVTRRTTTRQTMELSDTAVEKLARRIEAGVSKQTFVVQADDREIARYVGNMGFARA
jgi:phage-related protein